MTDMKKYLNYTLTALALVALMACSEDASSPSSGLAPDGGKELIAFSQEGSAMTTRAMTRAGFDSNTKVVMRIKADGETASDVRYTQAVATASAQIASDACNTDYGLVGSHSHLTYAAGQNRYWDDAFGRESKLTVYAVAVPNKNDDTILPSTILNQTGGTDASPDWYTIGTENTKIDWTVPATQVAATRLEKDLTYSNNIRSSETFNKGRYHQTYNSATSNWDKSMERGRMIWQPKTVTVGETTGKFDQGHLVFKHALSWITIVLNEGSGFNNGANTDFVWTNPPTQNITLKGFPTSGKLDVSTGAWSDMVTNDITQLDETTGTPANQTTRQLEAIVLPGTNLYSTSSNVIEFEIDNAKYYVSGTQIANAIRDFYKIGGVHENDDHAAEYRNITTMEAGKHYFVSITVSKKGVSNVTAAILDWETVNSSDATPDNVYCTFTFEDRGTKWDADDATKFNLYRAAKTTSNYITGETTPNYAWETGYDITPATKSYESGHWKTTDWFWPNNLTYYHFRAVGYADNTTGTPSVTISTNTTPDPDEDYFTITSGTLTGSSYKDYVWGAPFKDIADGDKLTYSTATGFDNTSGTTHQIAQALGATNSQINMLLFHVTSQIFVTVKTTTGADKVALKDETKAEADQLTKVEILNFLPNGKVLMGTGAVSATDGTRTANAFMGAGTWAAESGTTPEQVTAYSYGIVPQDLSWTTPSAGSIGLRITTPDGNQYVVKDLSTCTGTISTTNLINPYNTVASGTNYNITSWYPHYQYTYTITLKQTGIANITAAVLPWETVTGDLGTITLEN